MIPQLLRSQGKHSNFLFNLKVSLFPSHLGLTIQMRGVVCKYLKIPLEPNCLWSIMLLPLWKVDVQSIPMMMVAQIYPNNNKGRCQ
jgi:hypothetical protein